MRKPTNQEVRIAGRKMLREQEARRAETRRTTQCPICGGPAMPSQREPGVLVCVDLPTQHRTPIFAVGDTIQGTTVYPYTAGSEKGTHAFVWRATVTEVEGDHVEYVVSEVVSETGRPDFPGARSCHETGGFLGSSASLLGIEVVR